MILVLLWSACSYCHCLPHGGDDPDYQLRGLHAAVPCEGCHGPGVPEVLPTRCERCHADDVPSVPHYPDQGCGDCHDEAPPAWLHGVVDTSPLEETGTSATGETGGSG